MSPHRKILQAPLSRKAVLVSVRISQWTARKLDRKITDEVNNRHNATKDAGRYNKLIIAAEHLTELKSLVTKARSLHYTMTRPWADEGMRILPNALYAKFSDEFRVLKRDFDAAADRFSMLYPVYVNERKQELNGLFDPADYPTEIRSKFELTLSVMPFPDADDFRSDLDPETVDDIKAELAATSKAVIDNAMQTTAQEIIEKVGHMATKLKEYKNQKGERKFFLDSLVDNVRDLVELLPAFNLTDDPQLTAITQRIAKELCAEDASALRANDQAREVVAKSADDILAEVGKLLS